jgi:predicted GNAT family N-acyltransferase
MSDYIVEDVSWNLHRETLLSIRGKVFIEEQQVAEEIERDDKDDIATHFLLTHNDIALACGRMLPDGKVGRLAVLKEHRGQGLGRRLLDYIINHARLHGMNRLYLHAQAHAADFYLDAGFFHCGEPFEEAGIPHVAMDLEIDYSDARQFIQHVGYPHPFATLALQLAQSARRDLRIYSAVLDPDVFDSAELNSAITTLARRSRNSNIRMLINDARPVVENGHRLLTLSRRLSTSTKIRVLDEHPDLPDATFLVRDNDGVVYKPDERGRGGFYEPDSRASAKRFVEQFDRLWHWGNTDPRLQLLSI